MTICLKLRRKWLGAVALVLSGIFAVVPAASAQRVNLPASGAVGATGGTEVIAPVVDVGPVPGAQMLTLTVRLKPSADRVLALEQEIADQQTPGSAEYRKWVTPTEFAARFGANDEQVASVSAWLESQGLAVTGVSAGKTRLTVTGSALRVQSAFGVALRLYSEGANRYFANAGVATVPAEMAGLVADVSGLNDKAVVSSMAVTAIGPGGWVLPSTTSSDALTAIEQAADLNQASILLISSAVCSADLGTAEFLEYRLALKQAEAQGITVLATSECKGTAGKSGSFPASLAEVTAVAAPPGFWQRIRSGDGIRKDCGVFRDLSTTGLAVRGGASRRWVPRRA